MHPSWFFIWHHGKQFLAPGGKMNYIPSPICFPLPCGQIPTPTPVSSPFLENHWDPSEAGAPRPSTVLNGLPKMNDAGWDTSSCASHRTFQATLVLESTWQDSPFALLFLKTGCLQTSFQEAAYVKIPVMLGRCEIFDLQPGDVDHWHFCKVEYYCRNPC